MLARMAAEPPSRFVERVRRGVSYRGGKALERADRAMRRATTSARVRPTYLVIGAQKAGTSSLHHYLSQNPAVLTARVKEVQYFTKYYARGEGWYRAQFPLVTHERAVRRRLGVSPAVGEATAACLFDPRSPERVHAFDPEMKLIAVLRDPIERAYSHFQMELRWGRETGTFEEALNREKTELPGVLERLHTNPNVGVSSGLGRTYVARGLYADQLERWLQLFDREQLLILMSDDLDNDPAGTLSRVAGFLGVPELHAAEYPRRGVQEYVAMAPETRERLARTFASPTAVSPSSSGASFPGRARRHIHVRRPAAQREARPATPSGAVADEAGADAPDIPDHRRAKVGHDVAPPLPLRAPRRPLRRTQGAPLLRPAARTRGLLVPRTVPLEDACGCRAQEVESRTGGGRGDAGVPLLHARPGARPRVRSRLAAHRRPARSRRAGVLALPDAGAPSRRATDVRAGPRRGGGGDAWKTRADA